AGVAPGRGAPAFTVGAAGAGGSWFGRPPRAGGAAVAGVGRGEGGGGLAPAAVTTLADVTAAVLPRYASEPHKDQRAPQNLYPIGGLERELRHRLGDPALLYRGLRAAALSSSM